MKWLSLALALFGAASLADEVPPLPNFPVVRYSPNIFYESEGFRFGYLQKIDWTGILIWTYEGQLSLGIGTGPEQLLNEECVTEKKSEANRVKDNDERDRLEGLIPEECAIVNNPWQFSFMESRLYDQYNRMTAATPVVIYYDVPLISPKQLFTKTSNYVYAIYPVNADYPVQKHFETTRLPISLHFNPERDEIVGRIVKASLDHYLFKTYEVIIQKNVIGSSFVTMSVNDPDIFDQAVRDMLTGKVLRIGYVRLFAWEGDLFSLRGYDTNYRVVSLDVLDPSELPGVQPTPAR